MDQQEILALLDQKQISYVIYKHVPLYTMEDLFKANLPDTFLVPKNLFIRDDKKRNYYLITAMEDKVIDLKEFRKQFSTRPLSFASSEDLMKYLKLLKGSVTPFGLLNNEQVNVHFFLDQRFLETKIGIHPNINTATLFLNTKDLIALIEEHGNPITLF